MLRDGLAVEVWPTLPRPEEETTTRLLEVGRAGVLLCGEAGIGKSHVVARVREQLAPRADRIWFEVRATPSRAAIPLGVVEELIGDDMTTPTGAPPTAARLERTVAARLASLPADAVVIAEDIAHLDLASADLLAGLCRRGAIQLLATMRATGAGAEPLLRLAAEDVVARVDLPPLGIADVRRLVEEALAGPVDDDVVRELMRLTAGNPMFLRESVRSALGDGSLKQRTGVWVWAGQGRPGARLIDLVETELDGLAADERRALEMVAFAEPLPLSHLLSVSDHQTVSRLVDAGLLVQDQPGSGRPFHGQPSVRLASPMHSEVLRVAMGPVRHLELRAWMRGHLDEEPPEGLSSLLRWVGLRLEHGMEVETTHLLKAAGAASALCHHDFAMQTSSAAIDQLRGNDGGWLELVDALTIRAREARFRGHSDEAAQDIREAFEVLGTHRALPGIDRAQAVGSRLLDVGRLAADLEQYTRDRPGRALAISAEVHDRAVVEHGHLPSVEAGRLDRVVRLAWSGDFRELLTDAEGLCGSTGRVPSRLLPLVGPTVLALGFQGRLNAASALAGRGLEVAVRRSDRIAWEAAEIRAARHFALIYTGELERASGAIEEGASPRAWRDPAILRAGEARLLLATGDWRAAAVAARAAQQQFELRDPSGMAQWALATECLAAALLGDTTRAQELIAAVEAMPARTCRALHVDVEAHLVRAMLVCDPDRAAVRARALAKRARADGLQLAELEAWHLLAVAAPGSVAGEEGVSHVAALAAQVDVRLGGLFAQHVAVVAAGDRQSADALVGAMAACGRWVPLVAASRVELSPREHEIATLVTTGLSSPVIAERLVVSPRTVESHLARIYTKLGVNRRNQVAEALRSVSVSATSGRSVSRQ